MKLFRTLTVLAALAAIMALGSSAHAQSAPNAPQAKKQFPCGAGIVQNRAGFQRVAFQLATVPVGSVRVTNIGHASFFLESPRGVTVTTDYNDFFTGPRVPDIATMNTENRGHSSYNPDPAIKFVLRGWDEGQGIPRHDVRLGDVRVYNVPVNIENFGATATNFSSMFVVQAAGLCFAHMGHLRHALTSDQVAALGRIDVVFAPVDRWVTQSYEELLHNLDLIKPRLIIPMFSRGGGFTGEFIAEMRGRYPAKQNKGNSVTLARATLPPRTEILVVPPLQGFGFGGQPL